MRRRFAIAVFLCAAVLAAFNTVAQEAVDLGEETRVLARSLADARDAYDTADFSQAVSLLNRLVQSLGSSGPGSVPVEQEQFLIEALRIRGISYYNLGQMDAAVQDFELLIQFEPDFKLDSNLVSPKIVDAFEETRKRTTGLLQVRSQPPGADVRLGQRLIGATPVDPMRVAVGRYRLSVERNGFAPQVELVEVTPGETATFEATLERNARSVNVITSPASVRIFVDGEEMGTTSGTPPPGYDVELLARGLDPATVSGPLLVPFLRAGRHVIRAEMDCHASFEANFSVTLDGSDLPLDLQPIVLEPSIASVRFESAPSGATLYMDGERAGTTPVTMRRVCAGTHSVRMFRKDMGTWWSSINVESGADSVVRGELRLTLAALGSVRQLGLENRLADSWDEFLDGTLEKQGAYNRRALDGSEESASRWELYQRIEADPRQAPVLREATLQTLLDEMDADLVLVAVPRSETRAHMLLYGRHQGRPDRIEIDENSGEQIQMLAALLSQQTRIVKSWSGLTCVDTAGSSFPFVLELSPSVAVGTTVEPGDRILAIEGNPVVSRRDLEGVLATRAPGTAVPVTVERGSETKDAMIIVAQSPMLPRPGDRRVLVNKYLADLTLIRAVSTDEGERQLATIGIGVGYLMAGEAALALERAFLRAKLPAENGFSRGTLAYLTGLCHEAMGSDSRELADAAFAAAAGSPSATLWSDDGEFVAPLALSRQGTAR